MRGRASWVGIGFIAAGLLTGWAWLWPLAHPGALTFKGTATLLFALMLVARWFQRCPKCRDTAYAGPGSWPALWPGRRCRSCDCDFTVVEQR